MSFRILPMTRKIGLWKNKLLDHLKDRSDESLRLWLYHCEYIAAQRLRRSQQFLTFYTRFFGPNILINFLHAYRRQVQNKLRGCLIGTIAISAFNWDNERINYDLVKPYANDIEYAKKLYKSGHLCGACKKIFTSEKNSESGLCQCQVDKTFDDLGWKPYLEQNNMVIWRRDEGNSLYAYKAYAKYDDITAQDFLFVQTNIEYRKQWDNSVVRLEVIDSDPAYEDKSHVIYWEMRWPRLFANRDYVYCRRFFIDEENKLIIICNKSTSHPKFPLDVNKHRVQEYWSYMVIKPFTTFNEPGLEYVLTYFDNPGVSLPAAITSWVAQKQMPEFLTKLHLATKEYDHNKKVTPVMKSNRDTFRKLEHDPHHQARITKNSLDRENEVESGLILPEKAKQKISKVIEDFALNSFTSP